MVFDEPEIYGRHYMQIVTHPEWAVISRQRFCNTLAVEHKCSTSLPINEAHNYKREDNRS